MKPKLTLVGAGPGDPELLTLKGLKALQTADVILYDALASKEILEMVPSYISKIYVGKMLGNYVLNQLEINQLIVELALEKGHVVRLKGGDPFVLGRGYEEIEYAQKFGIETAVVPGLSSSTSVAGYNGIPVTSRGYADSFWVLTGTTKEGQLSADMKLAAKSNATIIILMGMSKIIDIINLFKINGKSETPMAIIQNGTRANQKMVLGTVKNISTQLKLSNISNPAIIIIGEVVALHKDFESMYSLLNNKQLV